MVTVTDWRLDELTPIALDYLHDCRWTDLFSAEETEETAYDLIGQSVEVAGDYPLGMVLRPCYDYVTELWYYHEDREQ
ncbi:hypothetical protein VXD82_06420 [Mycobacteroides chelonae]